MQFAVIPAIKKVKSDIAIYYMLAILLKAINHYIYFLMEF